MPGRFHSLVCWCALLTLARVTCFGWSEEGHRTVGVIAQSILAQNQTAMNNYQTLMGSVSLADVATCADQIRAFERNQNQKLDPECHKLFPKPPKGTSNLHFINIPIKDPGSEPARDEIRAACNKNCILSAIDQFSCVLRNPRAKTGERRQAVAWLAHFVGDIHQPLHTVVRNGDNGGNAEVIRFFGVKEKLHGIWDNQMVARIEPDPAKLADLLKPQVDEAMKEQDIIPAVWAGQAYDFARDVCYKGIPGANGDEPVATLADDYQNAGDPVIRRQIARAGIRLGLLLTDLLQ